MKRGIISFLLLGFLTLAYGANVTVLSPLGDDSIYIAQYALMSSSAVAGNGGTASSSAVDMGKSLYFGLWLKCAGSGPSVKVEWLESPTVVDTDFGLAATLIADHTGTSPVNYNVPAVPTRYGRLKLTGNSGNGANTTCTAKLSIWGMR
jgi:hypothetical protein